ncbi:hypothetical protein [Streptomyces sp. SPB78]|uniref:hypothetical protein n=1 Tax=Streptomyces sp. (strain SPB78) TaxID=591157 RepID=UPI0001B553A7|nr:hypothetical protein [Streptomyces sp. SPB78]
MNTTRGAKGCRLTTCLHCGAHVEQREGEPGRLRLYCTPDHGAQYRRRARALGWL